LLVPRKEVKFEFPTEYEDTGVLGDELWKELMPCKSTFSLAYFVIEHQLILNIVGAGFIRVPNPRRFDMPASEPIDIDDENAETYSLSITHQLHCLVSG
jgi:hypothetical protein